MKIIQTLPGDSHFKLFEELPSLIYTERSIAYKQADMINTTLLEQCFVLEEKGIPLSRVALYSNPDLHYQGMKTACLGNYEALENPAAASMILDYVSAFAKQSGVQYLIGPMNGSTWDSYRFSTHHQHPNFLSEPYHPLYYNEHFLHSGFEIIAHYSSSLDTELPFDQAPLVQREQELIREGVCFRMINLEAFDEELERIHAFNTTAFKNNFLYTPISKEAFLLKYNETKKIIDPQYVILAEDAQQNLIGYFFCFQDLFNTSEKSLIVKTIARHPDKRWRGLGHVIGNRIYRAAVADGYTSAIHAFMYQEGTSNGISTNFSGRIYKNYALYGKII